MPFLFHSIFETIEALRPLSGFVILYVKMLEVGGGGGGGAPGRGWGGGYTGIAVSLRQSLRVSVCRLCPEDIL